MNKIFKNTLILTAITVIAGSALGLVYEVTKAPIAQAQENAKQEACKKVFSTAVNVQIIMAVIIAVLIEIGGVWFLNYKMNIPGGRMVAANWLLQFSISLLLKRCELIAELKIIPPSIVVYNIMRISLMESTLKM